MPNAPRRAPRARADATDRRTAVEERRARANQEPLDVRVRSAEPYPVLHVRNPIHGTGYLVLLPTFPSEDAALCTCTDFARRGLGTCKHIEAGFRWLRGHPEALLAPAARRGRGRPSGLWRRIDRRVANRARDPAPPSLAWRRPGRLLFEETCTS